MESCLLLGKGCTPKLGCRFPSEERKIVFILIQKVTYQRTMYGVSPCLPIICRLKRMASIRSKPTYDPIRRFAYVGQIPDSTYMAATRFDQSANGLHGFIDSARATPVYGKLGEWSGRHSPIYLSAQLLNAADLDTR